MRKSPIEEPLFSIIIATYNRAHLLPRAINSVLNQTYQNFEIIVVDDGSTDNTAETVEPFKRDSRFIFHKLPQNRGTSAARNKGLDLATGYYVTFLDSDDELLPEALKTAVNKFAEFSSEGINVIWFDRIDYVTREVPGKSSGRDGFITYEDLICRRVRGDFWVVVERNIVGGLRFDERTFGYEGLLWLKLLTRTKFYHLPIPLYIQHREHGSTITNDFSIFLRHKEALLFAQEMRLVEHGAAIERCCPDIYGRELVTLGFAQICNGKRIEGRRSLLKSLRFHVALRTLVLLLAACVLNEKQIIFLYSKYCNVFSFIRERL